MARIFISFYNAIGTDDPKVMPCFYETFVNGLIKSGNELLVETTDIWNFKQTKCPLAIKKKIKDFNPDVCFLFNNCFYDISHLVDCPIVVYEVDSFLFYKNKSALYNNPNRFYYFVPQTSSFEILQNELHVDKSRICYVPFFTEIHAKNEPIKNNICFCGSKFTNGDRDSIIRKFVLLKPSSQEIKLFKESLSLIVSNPYITVEEIENKIGKLSEKLLCILRDPYLIGYLSDVRRIKTLKSVSDLGLSLHGTTNWINDLAYSDLPLSYDEEKIFSLTDTEKLYNSHRIGININNIQATTGFGWRVADIMASNACLVSEYKPDFKRLFPNIDIPFFESASDAYDVCKKLLENENMRLDIVAQCQGVIEKGYRFEHTLRLIEQFLGISLSTSSESCNTKVVFLPSIREKPHRSKKKLKQIIYSFGLFVSTLLFLSGSTNGNFQSKLKKKLDRYI